MYLNKIKFLHTNANSLSKADVVHQLIFFLTRTLELKPIITISNTSSANLIHQPTVCPRTPSTESRPVNDARSGTDPSSNLTSCQGT